MENNELLQKIEKLEHEMAEMKASRGLRGFIRNAFTKSSFIVGIALAAALTGFLAWAAQVTFTDGTVISAAEVNANFTELYDRVGTLESNVSGKVKNVYFASATTRQTINSTTPQEITGLSITLTPASVNSKFLIFTVINGSMNYVSSTLIYRDGDKLLTHANSSISGSQATTAFDLSGDNNAYMRQQVINYLDSPSTASSITYSIRMASAWSTVAHATYINNRDSNDMGTPSTLTILEIEE